MMFDVGLVLILFSLGWIVFCGNGFGLFTFSKKIQAEYRVLIAKEVRGEQLSPAELQNLRYFRLNDSLNSACYFFLVLGIFIFILSLIFNYKLN